MISDYFILVKPCLTGFDITIATSFCAALRMSLSGFHLLCKTLLYIALLAAGVVVVVAVVVVVVVFNWRKLCLLFEFPLSSFSSLLVFLSSNLQDWYFSIYRLLLLCYSGI